jgi:hypothetical protein
MTEQHRKARPLRRVWSSTAALASVLVVATAVAGIGSAVAGPPGATTGAATAVTDTTATLEGTVFPNREETTYYFEYGTTTAYGARTPDQGPTGGNAGKSVNANVTGLAPSTTYHFRVVAVNPSGTAFGSDATFTTAAPGAQQPPGRNAVTIAAAPPTVTFGRPTTISGQVTGPDNANVEVTLEENPHPFTGGFKATAVKTTTNATGAYTMAVTPSVNTRYRVTAKTKPPVTSPETTVDVRVRVGFRLSDRTPAVGQRVRFSGIVTPGHDGTVARIQRRFRTGWRTVARATLVAATPVNGVARSRYSNRLRINRSGTFRVRVTPTDGDHVRGTSARRRARVH